MIRRMKIDVFFGGGRNDHIEKDIIYEGESEEEIAKMIQDHENDILYFMRTGDNKGEECFCLNGFMIKKNGIRAIQLSESDY